MSNHRRRVMTADGYLNAQAPATIIALTIRDGSESWVCPWCERPMRAKRPAERHPNDRTIEHIVPKSEGGTDHLDNQVLACSACNHKRS